MKWNSLDIIKFLAIYEHFPILWNFKLKDVQSSQTKESEFWRLSDELRIAGLLGDMTDKQLKAKIKCIKDVLRQELTKVHKSMLNCVNPKDVYRPKLAWFDSAEFLRDIMSTSGPRHSRLEFTQEKQEYVEPDEPDAHPVKRTLDTPPLCYASINRHKTKKMKTMLPSEVQHNTSNLSDSPSGTSSGGSKHEDVYDQFGKYIACELRSLPPREAILVKQEIQNIVTKVHLGLCQPNPANSFEFSHQPMPIDYVSPSYSHSSDSEENAT